MAQNKKRWFISVESPCLCDQWKCNKPAALKEEKHKTKETIDLLWDFIQPKKKKKGKNPPQPFFILSGLPDWVL